MFWRVDIFSQLLRFHFDVLIVEEDTDQCTRLVGMRQRDETFVFQIQRFFAAKAGGGFNGFNGGNRGRVVFPAVCATMPLAMVKLIAASILLR